MDIPLHTGAGRTNAKPATPTQRVAGTMPQSFGFKLRHIQMAYKRLFLQIAGPDCIPTNQIGALSVIARNPDITPGDIAALMTIDAAQLTPIIKQLEIRAFVRRVKSATDSRSHSLHATALGLREYKRMQIIIARVDDLFIGTALHEDEVGLFSEMLDRVLAADRIRSLI